MCYLLSFAAEQFQQRRSYQAHNGYRTDYGARLFDCVKHFHGVPPPYLSMLSAADNAEDKQGADCTYDAGCFRFAHVVAPILLFM